MSTLPREGDRFGRFVVRRQVGRGGMGAVYEALDTTLNRSVALKVIRPDLDDIGDIRDRFRREAAVLARIRSRHIVQIHEFGMQDGAFFLVTEFMPDGDLHTWLQRNGAMAPHHALLLVAQMCEGLADAHAAQVIHRDLKPSNVLLWNRSDQLVAYLCDFGIATDGELGVTKTGILVGSPAYMAPERHIGMPADARGDVYSVGCVLWACLTGQAPFSGTDYQVMDAHLNKPLPPLPPRATGGAPVDELLARVLSKDPAARPADPVVLREELLELAASVPPPADGPAPVRTGPEPVSAGWYEDEHEGTILKPWSPTGAVASESPRFLPLGDGSDVAPDTELKPWNPRSPVETPQPLPQDNATGRRSRWLVAGAVGLAVLATVVSAVLISLVLGGDDTEVTPAQSRASSAQDVASSPAPPQDSPSPASSTPEPTASFSCWSGLTAESLRLCGRPQGRVGLAWVFPKMERQGCSRHSADRLQLWECQPRLPDGTQVRIHYSQWSSARQAERHYSAPGFTERRLTTPQGLEYQLWSGVGVDPDYPYKAAALLADLPFSLSVYADTAAARDDALRLLAKIRPVQDLRGVPAPA